MFKRILEISQDQRPEMDERIFHEWCLCGGGQLLSCVTGDIQVGVWHYSGHPVVAEARF